MGAYDKERLENLILYFAKRYFDEFGFNTNILTIGKMVAAFEFAILNDIGKPPINLQYKATYYGSIPIILYTEKIKSIDDLSYYYYHVSLEKPNFDYFSEYECTIMRIVYNDFSLTGKIYYSTSRAWEVAFKRETDSLVNFDDEFEFKDKDNLTSQEDAYLNWKSINAICID